LTFAGKIFLSVRVDGGWGESPVIVIACEVSPLDVHDKIGWQISFCLYTNEYKLLDDLLHFEELLYL